MHKIAFFHKHQNWFFIILIFLISLVPFFWLKHYILNINDTVFVIDPLLELYVRSFTWKDLGLGVMQSRGITLLILYQFPLFILFKIGLSLTIIQKMLFSYWLFFSGFSFFVFIKYILRGKHANVAAFLGANFYMFNMFSLQFFWHLPVILFIYAFLPLILLYCVKLFKSPNAKDFVILTILAFLCSPGINNLLLVLVMAILIITYLFLDTVLQMIDKENNEKFLVRKKFISVLLIGLSFLLAWAYVLIPALNNFKNEIKGALSVSTINLEYIGNASFSKVAEGFRFFGHFGFFGGYKGSLYFPFSDVYSTPLFIFFGFLLTFIAFLSFLFIKDCKKHTIIFGILALGSFLLINGPKSALGSVFIFLFKNVPLFSIFRNPIDKIGLIFIFSMACLMAISIQQIIIRLKNKRFFYGFIALMFLSINLVAFPFITGSIFPDFKGSVFFSNKVDVPSYYKEASSYLNKQKNRFRVYTLPVSYLYNKQYLWGYSGPDPLSRLLEDKYFSTSFKTEYGSVRRVLTDIRDDKDYISKFVKLSSLFNIKQIILENDIDSVYYKYTNVPIVAKEKLLNSKDVTFDKTFGQLEFYTISNKYFLPFFYVPKNLIITDKDLDALPQIVSAPYYNLSSAIFFEDQNLKKMDKLEKIKRKVTSTPILEFGKISPIKYSVRIHQANGSFPLVLSNGFHKGWKVYTVNSTKTKRYEINEKDLKNYKILDGNDADQATSEELKKYIYNKWVTYLPTNKKIDFVSKNFKGSIQNNNLPKGDFNETYFKKFVSESNHFVANGYANSWLIDVDDICLKQNICKKNSNGTYDLDLIVEFWPQRVFYLGLITTGITILFCLIYLVIFVLKICFRKQD